jgi:hypothetical protein
VTFIERYGNLATTHLSLSSVHRRKKSAAVTVQTYTHLFIGLVLLAIEWAAYWEVRRQRALLREWADANGV